ncbi:DUF4806 domain-containing protein, partial [Aphis craccivora]
QPSDTTVLSPKQAFDSLKSPKRASTSQKFSSQYKYVQDTIMSSPKLQDYVDIVSPKKTLSQKSISYATTTDEITPIKKTPTKISFNVYSPSILMSSQKRNVKKQLFKTKENSIHSASSMKTSSMISSNTSKQKFLTDDQFKDMVSHNLIIIKHSIRNLNEKLDLIIERNNKFSQNSENNLHEDDIDYANLNCIFPIDDINTLSCIEEQLASADQKYHKLMTNKLVGLGGKTIQIYIKRVMQLLFTDELLQYYSFSGRANKKKCFSNLIISKLIFSK